MVDGFKIQQILIAIIYDSMCKHNLICIILVVVIFNIDPISSDCQMLP